MSQRDRDARAAMREILRGLVTGDIDGPMEPAELAHNAWNYADAMAAERQRRVEAEAPRPGPTLTAEQVMELGRRVGREEMDAACDQARREGRDAGLREGKGQCEHGLPVYSALAKDADRLTDRLKAMADENAKLQAVAEAAARMQRWREDDRGSDDDGEAAGRALASALDRALPGWRSRGTP